MGKAPNINFDFSLFIRGETTLRVIFYDGLFSCVFDVAWDFGSYFHHTIVTTLFQSLSRFLSIKEIKGPLETTKPPDQRRSQEQRAWVITTRLIESASIPGDKRRHLHPRRYQTTSEPKLSRHTKKAPRTDNRSGHQLVTFSLPTV